MHWDWVHHAFSLPLYTSIVILVEGPFLSQFTAAIDIMISSLDSEQSDDNGRVTGIIQPSWLCSVQEEAEMLVELQNLIALLEDL